MPGSAGGVAGTNATVEHLISKLLAATTTPSDTSEEALKAIQEQIRDAVEKETDPDKIRRLLDASERLASLTRTAPGSDLEKLLNAALRGHAESASAPQSGPSGHVAQWDLEALTGTSQAEQEAARDAEVILHVGEMVRSARMARGITQAELAAQTGMTQPHISEIERGLGRIGPTVVTLRRLLNALGDDLVIESAKGNSRPDEPAQKRPSRRRS